MKIGLSSYCFAPLTTTDQLSVRELVRWVAQSEADHLEVALPGLSGGIDDLEWNLDDDPELFDALSAGASEDGLELSGLCMGSSFIGDPEFVARQVARVKHHVDLADRLGVRLLRHDVTPWPLHPKGTEDVEAHLPTIIEACREVAQYANRYGITTSIENHGFFINGSERVRRVVTGVDEPNFKTTLDIGNFVCVDEDPVIATRLNLPYASTVQLKDFYLRDEDFALADDNWIRTAGGRYILGAIVGYGDLNLPAIARSIRDSGFDGYVSIEFEGREDPFRACPQALRNTRTLLAAETAV